MSHNKQKIILSFKKAKEKRENLANARANTLFFADDKFYTRQFGGSYG
jgi:hypothetical protein